MEAKIDLEVQRILHEIEVLHKQAEKDIFEDYDEAIESKVVILYCLLETKRMLKEGRA